MKIFKLFSVAVLALMIGACSSNDDNVTEQQRELVKNTIRFKATIDPAGSNITRTTYTPGKDANNKEIVKVAWKVGDQIALIHNSKKDVVTVTAVDSDGNATIEGDITKPTAANEAVNLVYPAAFAIAETGAAFHLDDEKISSAMLSQDGTLAFIARNLDVRVTSTDFQTAMNQIIIADDKASVSSKITMESMIAIWKLNFHDASGINALPAKGLSLGVALPTDLDTPQTVARATNDSAMSTYYMCLMPRYLDELYATGDFSFFVNANVGSSIYKYTFNKEQSFEYGKFYENTLILKPTAEQSLTTAQANNAVVMIRFMNGAQPSSCIFKRDGSGGYTKQQGGIGLGSTRESSMAMEDGKIVFRLNTNSTTLSDNYSSYGFTVTFDPDANTYRIEKGSSASAQACTFSGIVVNGTDITTQLKSTLLGLFSVSDVTTVRFAPGNLQYRSGASAPWRFAPHQYDYVGSWDQDNWIDLFGWGAWTGKPDSPLKDVNEGLLFAWNSDDFVQEYLLENASLRGYDWRTLSLDEWRWLLGYGGPYLDITPEPGTDCRVSSKIGQTDNARFLNATVNGVKGMIIFPDVFVWDPVKMGDVPMYCNSQREPFRHTLTIAQWKTLETAGAVFLPCAGYYSRSKSIIENCNEVGIYASSSAIWSESKQLNYNSIEFDGGDYGLIDYSEYGISVRLVREDQ